jgi:hypothetical protein
MQVKSLATIALTIAIWGCAEPVAAAAAPLRSGFYEGFVLAVSPSGRVVGHFNMEQGEGVTKRCIFDFVGRASGNQAVIRTVGSPNLSGRITASAADEVMFSMAHVRSLPGCGLDPRGFLDRLGDGENRTRGVQGRARRPGRARVPGQGRCRRDRVPPGESGPGRLSLRTGRLVARLGIGSRLSAACTLTASIPADSRPYHQLSMPLGDEADSVSGAIGLFAAQCGGRALVGAGPIQRAR